MKMTAIALESSKQAIEYAILCNFQFNGCLWNQALPKKWLLIGFLTPHMPKIKQYSTRILKITVIDLQGGPERLRQSNLALFAVEGRLDSKLPVAK